jgi:hypothetical protein
VILKISRDGISEVIINTLRVSLHDIIKNMDPMLTLKETDRRISEDIVGMLLTEALIAELEKKYNLKYDRSQERFFVNQLELVYNMDFSNNLCKPVWVIR